jgi:hypothetical protein
MENSSYLIEWKHKGKFDKIIPIIDFDILQIFPIQRVGMCLSKFEKCGKIIGEEDNKEPITS